MAGVASTVAIQGDDGSLIDIRPTADNADERIINAAITYVTTAPFNGGSVFIDEGTYTLAASVDLLDAIYLYGAGLATILTIPAGTDDCIDTNTAEGFKLAFMTVQTTGIGANDAILVNGSTIGEIFSVYISASGQDGISIDNNSYSINIHDNVITQILRYGINHLGFNCHIQDNRINTTEDDGIWLQLGGTYCVVNGNRIDDWTNEAIDWDDSTCQVSHNITAV